MNIEDIIGYIVPNITKDIASLVELETKDNTNEKESINNILKIYNIDNKILQLLNSLSKAKKNFTYKKKKISLKNLIKILKKYNFAHRIKEIILNEYKFKKDKVITNNDNKSVIVETLIINNIEYQKYVKPIAAEILNLNVIYDERERKSKDDKRILIKYKESIDSPDIDIIIKNPEKLETDKIEAIIHCPSLVYEGEIKFKGEKKTPSMTCKLDPDEVKRRDSEKMA